MKLIVDKIGLPINHLAIIKSPPVPTVIVQTGFKKTVMVYNQNPILPETMDWLKIKIPERIIMNYVTGAAIPFATAALYNTQDVFMSVTFPDGYDVGENLGVFAIKYFQYAMYASTGIRVWLVENQALINHGGERYCVGGFFVSKTSSTYSVRLVVNGELSEFIGFYSDLGQCKSLGSPCSFFTPNALFVTSLADYPFIGIGPISNFDFDRLTDALSAELGSLLAEPVDPGEFTEDEMAEIQSTKELS
ncbi:MAG: hypothetical protein ABIL58_07955 [Pseudomonadota bacterium]